MVKAIFLSLLSLILTLSPLRAVGNSKIVERDKDKKTPEQISVAISESSSSMNVTFTTISQEMSSGYVLLNKVGEKEVKRFDCSFSSKGVTNSSFKDDNDEKIKAKLFYNTKLTGLEPNTHYEYQCFTLDSYGVYNSQKHDFWSPISETSDEEYSFIYIADPQANISDGKAISTTTEFAKTLVPEAKFMYIAGDLINGSWPNYDEEQWETLFNTPGSKYFNPNYSNQISNYTIAAVQGNHDEETLNGHINHPSLEVKNSSGEVIDTQKITYSFSWGNMRFVILNTEWRSSTDYQVQKEFVASEVSKAKTNNQRIAVCFHRSMYTGADHIESEDSIERRKQFSKYFSDLGVDFVFQGHDHVVARGQVDGSGHKTSVNDKVTDRIYLDHNPSNAPLYFVGGTASTFKAYGWTNYSVTSGDPLIANYDFLDLNSAADKGTKLNPLGPSSFNGVVSPSFTKVTVGKDFTKFDTYCYSYNVSEDRVVNSPILYDSYTVTNDIEKIKNEYLPITNEVQDASGAQVKVQKMAKPNEQVLFGFDMEEDKQVNKIEVVTASGNKLEYQENKFAYTFVMPNEPVKISINTTRNKKLPIESVKRDVTSFGSTYLFKGNLTELTPDCFSSTTTGFESLKAPIENAKLDSPIVMKKTFTIFQGTPIDRLYGFSGEHAIDGSIIAFINGHEFYRYNSGVFGQVKIGRSIDPSKINEAYESGAIERQFAFYNDEDNYVSSYLAGNDYPLLQAASVSNLRGNIKIGENVLTILYYPSSSARDYNYFDMSLVLEFHSSEINYQWKQAIETLKSLIPNDDSKYLPEDYNYIVNIVNNAIEKIETMSVITPYELTKLVENISLEVAQTPNRIDKTILAIEELRNLEVTNSIKEKVENAKNLFESLNEEEKKSVSNIDLLLEVESKFGELINAIVIEHLPEKVNYLRGDKLDLTGIKVSLVRNNSNTENIDISLCEISGFDSTYDGNKIVIIKYLEFYTYFTVSVSQ